MIPRTGNIKRDKQTGLLYEDHSYSVEDCKCKSKHIYYLDEMLPCGFGHDKWGCDQNRYSGHHIQDVQDGTIKEQQEFNELEMMEDSA